MKEVMLKGVRGLGSANEYAGTYANFPVKEELEVGTLVALEEGLLVKADENKKPVGVVHMSTVKAEALTTRTGMSESLEKPTFRAGKRLDLYKFFVLNGVDLKKGEWAKAKIGDDVYVGAKGVLTITKPAKGWRVGIVERLFDQMVRFDLANIIAIG